MFQVLRSATSRQPSCPGHRLLLACTSALWVLVSHRFPPGFAHCLLSPCVLSSSDGPCLSRGPSSVSFGGCLVNEALLVLQLLLEALQGLLLSLTLSCLL